VRRSFDEVSEAADRIMKLALVNHYRCDQPAGKFGLHTYVWVPDDMSEHEFGLLCEAARDMYLENEKRFKTNAPAFYPGQGPVILPTHEDKKTVGELRAEYNAIQKAWEDFEETKRNNRKPFSTLLVEVSNGAIKQFWQEPAAVTHKVNWGHNHGTTIDYGPTKIGDFPGQDDDDDDI
jgi:hypothetical protein